MEKLRSPFTVSISRVAYTYLLQVRLKQEEHPTVCTPPAIRPPKRTGRLIKEPGSRSLAYRGINIDQWQAPLDLLIMLAWKFMTTFHACGLTGAFIVSVPSHNRRPVSGPFYKRENINMFRFRNVPEKSGTECHYSRPDMGLQAAVVRPHFTSGRFSRYSWVFRRPIRAILDIN